MKSLRRHGVTALLVGWVWPAAAASYDVPLRVEAGSTPVGAYACDYWRALSNQTGFAVRLATAEESPWLARIGLRGSTMRIALKSPDGRAVADKVIEVRDPCATAIEILAILFAAHVPAFEIEQREARAAPPLSDPAPPAQPAPAAPPPADTPEPAASDLPPPLDPPATVLAELPQLPWLLQVGVVPSLVLLADKPRYLVAVEGAVARGEARLGLRVGGSYERSSVRSGSFSLIDISARLLATHAVATGDLGARLGPLAGARVLRASTTGLGQNSSATIISAELGAAVEATWRMAPAFEAIAGVSALTLLPRPTVAVGGLGTVFAAPVIFLDLYLGVSWETPI